MHNSQSRLLNRVTYEGMLHRKLIEQEVLDLRRCWGSRDHLSRVNHGSSYDAPSTRVYR
jgi:hypothetical protein